MRRALFTSIFGASLVIGCVTVGPVGTVEPSLAPTSTLSQATSSPLTTASPSLITPSPIPTAAPTATPTVVQTATPPPPTPEVTIPPLETPTPTPTPTQEVTPGPEETPIPTSPDELFNDVLSDESSGWGTTTNNGGTIAYVAGGLQFDVNDGGAWLWSSRETGDDNSAMKAVGEFLPSGDGKFGIICGSGTDALFGAIVDTSGGWAFVSIGADGEEVLLGDESAGLDVPIGESSVLGLDCWGTSTGALRMQLSMTGTGPIALYESEDGPESFDRVAAYAESIDDAFTVRLENVLAFGTGDPSGTLDDDASDLVGHVPDEWQGTCADTALPPLLGRNATALITCFVGDLGSGSEVAAYVQFPTKDDMDAAYDLHMDRFPVDVPVDSCNDGPGEHPYDIGTADAGRLLCAPQFVGIRYDWTDDRLNILSSLVDHDSSYADVFQDWLIAGPNI